MSTHRHPAGTSVGGQWAPGAAGEVEDGLDAGPESLDELSDRLGFDPDDCPGLAAAWEGLDEGTRAQVDEHTSPWALALAGESERRQLADLSPGAAPHEYRDAANRQWSAGWSGDPRKRPQRPGAQAAQWASMALPPPTDDEELFEATLPFATTARQQRAEEILDDSIGQALEAHQPGAEAERRPYDEYFRPQSYVRKFAAYERLSDDLIRRGGWGRLPASPATEEP